MPRGLHASFPAVAASVVIFGLSSSVFASGVVSHADENSLAAAMAGGGTVTFAVEGTIYLTNTIVVSNNTVLDATGRSVSISGSNSVQIFIVNSNTTLAMTNLTLRDGFVQGSVQNQPYAVLNADGGAICNGGTLQMTSCAFISNGAAGLTNGFYGEAAGGNGGAIYNWGKVVSWGCFFVGNSAAGAAGQSTVLPGNTDGGAANGGGFFNANQATFMNCVFSNNTATGGLGASPFGPYTGSAGGAANGGALCNSGSLVASNNTFAQNVALGGQGGTGGSEYSPIYAYQGGAGGVGGTPAGGAVCFLGGSSVLVNDTFWSNSACGGAGGTGGPGSTVMSGGQDGNGGNGGQGGNGIGGALCASGGSLLAWNVTVASNSAAAGAGGVEGAGGSAFRTTSGSPGGPGSSGVAEGHSVGNLGGVVTVKNSILCPNAPSDTNIFGSIVDAGYNINSDLQNSLTNATSLNGVNPELAPLGNYGGPSPTMALLPDSPAIDAADPTDFPGTDQRGFPRPYGPAPDVGSFEYSSSITVSGQIAGLLPGDQAALTAGHSSTLTTNHGAYTLVVYGDPSSTISPVNADYVFAPAKQAISLFSNQTGVNFKAYRVNAITLGLPSVNSLNLAFAGTSGQQFRVETSTNFTGWTPIVTNAIGAAGYLNVSFPMSHSGTRFFRLVSP